MSTTPPNPAPANEHQTTRERVLAIAGWLVDGKLRPECVYSAMQDWQVSRRTAQVLVARAARRIVLATTDKDPLFAMKLSQVQRDRLHQEVQELLRRGEFLPLPHWQMKVKTIQTAIKLLENRDRTAAKIAQLEEKNGKAEERRQQARRREEARGTEKTLRPEPPPAPPPAKSEAMLARTEVKSPRPSGTPRSSRSLERQAPAAPDFHEMARAAILVDLTQPAASISIVPPQQKAKADKEMRPAPRAPSSPAPGADSCALETKQVANQPKET